MPNRFMSEEARDRFAAWGAILTILSDIPRAKDTGIKTLGDRLLSLVMMENYILGYSDAPEQVAKLMPGAKVPTAFALWALVDDVTHGQLKSKQLTTVPPRAYRSGRNLWVIAAGGHKPTLEMLLKSFALEQKVDAIDFLPGFGDWP